MDHIEHKLQTLEKYRVAAKESGETDIDYILERTEHFGCHTMLMLTCTSIAGHSDIRALTPDEWEAFAASYSKALEYFGILERLGAHGH